MCVSICAKRLHRLPANKKLYFPPQSVTEYFSGYSFFSFEGGLNRKSLRTTDVEKEMSHLITVVKILQSQDLFFHNGETFMCTCYTQRLCSYFGPDECVQRTIMIVANLARFVIFVKTAKFIANYLCLFLFFSKVQM